MAIFQPTNQTPSSFAQGTVDAVKDNMEVSWQVNGNSAMTAFQIDFFLNDTTSTPVYSTGKLPKAHETQAQYNLPFYGTDRFGRPQFFTYNANRSWAQASMLEANPFTNGNNYKFKITQWYEGANEVIGNITANVTAGRTYYFTVPIGNTSAGAVVYFTVSKTLQSKTFFYSLSSGQGWYTDSDGYRFIGMTLNTNGNHDGMTLLGTAANVTSETLFVVQTSSSDFITRQTPTLTLYQTDENYENAVLLPSSLATSIGYFIADYQQAQGDPIRWIRWQVATANNGVVGDILADTGDIYTPTLNFEFNGFFNGNQYAIRCVGESESGQVCDTGWKFFNISFTQNTYDGNFTAHCLNKENATLLEWEGVEVILPTVMGDYTLNNGSVTLTANSSISWDKKKDGKVIPFANPWTAVWKCSFATTTSFSQFQIGGSPTTTSRPINNVTVAGTHERQPNGTYLNTFRFRPLSGGWYVYSVTNAVFSGAVTGGSTQINADGSITILAYSTFSPIATCTATITYRRSAYIKTLYVNGKANSVELSNLTNVFYSEYALDRNKVTITLCGYNNTDTLSATTNVTYTVPVAPSGNKLFSLNGDDIYMGFSGTRQFELHINGNTTQTVFLPSYVYSITAILQPNKFYLLAYNYDATVSSPTLFSYDITQITVDISNVAIFGGNYGCTVDGVSIYQGSSDGVLQLYYDNPDFEPVWNSSNYSLYMTANFNGNIQGGTGNAEGNGFQVYRREVGGSVLTPIVNVSALTTSLKDYGIRSRKAYEYLLGVYDSNNAFMGIVTAQNTIATCFKNYSLLVCDYDYDKDEYHVRKQYLFALNLSTGSVGNNNSPTLNANFTQYPTRMPSTQNYASGTLSGLIGAIYTVPALIEQIGQYKYTTKPSTLDYFDSVDLEKELYDLSTAPYQLFLRDMKGWLRMIATNGAISMTTNIKQKQQSISISFPWVEIGDASDVTIIQTPDDYGWNNDSQVLDVQLDVDVATGELSATYPFPYNGTKFYLTGVNKENLTVKTPLEVTPAQFNLSDTATKTTDGEVAATVTANSEVDK